MTFYKFHQEILRSQGLHEDGWTREKNIEVKEEYIKKAKEIIALNARFQQWGWKDPRTTLFLEFWHQLLPDAKFLFIYRSPWDVVDSLYRRGDDIFQKQPELALQVWLHYNQKILDFHNQFPDICLLSNIQTITNYEKLYLETIDEKFKTNLTPPDTKIYDPLLLKIRQRRYPSPNPNLQ